VKTLMLALATVAAPAVLCSCASMIARTDPVSLQKYDDLSQCARDAEVNPVRANCGERFKGVEMSGEFEELKIEPNGTYVMLRPRTDGSHMSCWLDGPQDKGQLAALTPGNMVTIKGTLHGRTVRRNSVGDVVWATLELRPCELLSVKSATATR